MKHFKGFHDKLVPTKFSWPVIVELPISKAHREQAELPFSKAHPTQAIHLRTDTALHLNWNTPILLLSVTTNKLEMILLLS